MGNCQTKKATRDAVASSPSSGQDEQKLHAAVPREAATNASDTEPTTPEKAEGPTSVVSQSPSQDAVVQSAVEDDHQGVLSKAISRDSRSSSVVANHGAGSTVVSTGGDDFQRDSSAKSSVLIPLDPTVDASTVVSASGKSRSGQSFNKDGEQQEEGGDNESFMGNETVFTREEEKSKSFMDKLDTLRDSCCGGGGGSGTATLNAEQYDMQYEQEKDNDQDDATADMSRNKNSHLSTTISRSEDEKSAIAAETYPMPETGESLEKEPSSVSKRTTSFMSRVRSKASGVNMASSKDSAAQRSVESSSVVTADTDDPNYKQKRKLNKKLREIEVLESKDPDSLTPEQREKLESKASVLQSLKELE